MNPRPGQTRSFIYRICTVEGCGERHYSRGLCGLHWSPRRDPLNVPAAPAPPFPRRTIVADYCRECGRTSDCWQGCAGGERVAPISHTRSPESARLENERGSLDGPGQYVGASLSEHRKGAPNEKA